MGALPSSYDVFLSYHWQDHAAVEPIARALRERGLQVFLDRWYLTPGVSWVDKLASTLGNCRTAAVLIGPHGLGRWQQRERDLALERQARDPAFPVIPVLLPNSEPALDFLALNSWVDLRGGVADPVQLEVLAKAVRGEPPGPDMLDSFLQTRAEICPYRGLHPFREEDARFFCGREVFTDTLGKALGRRSLVAVVGASGSGKSSVVRAGLLPQLRGSLEGSRVFEVATMVPGERPLLRLGAALVPLLEPELDEIEQLGKAGELGSLLQCGTVSLRDVVARVFEKQPGTDQLLLVVDQWEELYTLCRDETVRQRFLAEILSASDPARLSVVLTIRGDFYGHALGDRAFADRLQDSVVNLGPMTRDELRRAIEQPASEVGLRFEDGLVDRILDDVGDEPGNLPLLEFVLEMLWQRRNRGEMHHQAYVDIGGVRGAIAKRANETYDALSPAEQEATRRALIRLVRPGEGTEDTRRRAALDDLDADARPVVDRLAAARLLVTGSDPALGKDIVEISHEALIQHWELLRKWIDENREFLRTRERLGTAAEYWQINQREKSLLLFAPRPLAEGKDLLAKRRGDLDIIVIEFIEASIGAELERSQILRDMERRRLGLRGVAMVMLILGVGAGIFGLYARKESEFAQDSLVKAQIAQSRLLAFESQQETDAGNGTNGILLALEALPKNIKRPERPYIAEAEVALFKAVQGNREQCDLRGHTVTFAAFSPDGSRIITASWDNTAQVWDATTGRSLAVLQGHAGPVFAVAFSPDDTRVVTAASDNTARLWDAASGQSLVVLQGHFSEVYSAAFSPDGTRIVTASNDRTARVWDAVSGRSMAVMRGHAGGVNSATFSPDGTRIATASDDNTARVWDAASGRSLAVLQGHLLPLRSVAFSPDGTRVVTASDDNTARLWSTESGLTIAILRGHTGRIHSAAFSPDGTRVVTASDDNTARVWDAALQRTPGQILRHTGPVNSAAFSPDGTRVVTASDDNTARVWDAASGRSLAVLQGHTDTVRWAAFSPDGTRVVTASDDNTARVWDAALQRTPGQILRHTGPVNSAAFSPDGTHIVTASDDETAKVWDMASGHSIAELQGHTGPVYSAAFSSEGSRIVTASPNGGATVWDVTSDRSASLLRTLGEPVMWAAFSPDGTRIATTSIDDTARVWNVASGRSQAVLSGHTGWVHIALFSPDGTRIVTASDDDTARVWDASSGRSQAVMRGHAGGVNSATFSPDGTRIVTASDDNTARVWNASSGQSLTVLRGHMGAVSWAAFSPDGTRIVTASDDNTARLWSTESGLTVAILQGHTGRIHSVAFSPDGSHILTASEDGTARVWMIFPSTQSLIDYARANVPRLLTGEERQRFFLASSPVLEANTSAPAALTASQQTSPGNAGSMTAPVAPAAVPPDTPPAAALVKFDGGTISLDVKDNAYAGIGDAFAALITAKLSSSDRLRMVDRRFLAEVPKETRLSNLASSRLIIGKIIDAKYLICGAYTIEGDQVAVSMWMDSTETGQVLESKSVSGRIQDFHAVAQKLAVDFLQEFQQTTSAQAVYSASAVNRRTTVAVSDFYGRSVPPGNEKKDPLGKALAGFLIADLGASSKLHVLDREHTPEILLEQHIATSELSDPATRVRAGQILESRYFVFGSYAIAPNEQTILTAQIVSVAAGQIVESKSVSGDSKDLRALSQRLAADLRQSLENESTLGRQGVLENRRLESE